MRSPISSAAGKRFRLQTARGLFGLGLLFLGLALSRPPVWKSGTVSGTVVDFPSGRPLGGVRVSWNDRQAVTGADGRYRLEVAEGFRRLALASPGFAAVEKTILLRDASRPVTLDVLLPGASARLPLQALALERGRPLTDDGQILPADFAANSTLFLADGLGNQDRCLDLPTHGFTAYGPLWSGDGGAVFYGLDGIFHREEDRRFLGLYRWDRQANRNSNLLTGKGVRFLARSPDGSRVAAAGGKALYIADTASGMASPERPIYSLERERGWILSVAWGPGGWIYVAVDDQPLVDRQRSVARYRIARLRPDGTNLEPAWAADNSWCYGYPRPSADGTSMLYARFKAEGNEMTLWKRALSPGNTGPELVSKEGLIPVWFDPGAGWLYFISRGGELRLKNLRSGAAWTIVQAVEQADALP